MYLDRETYERAGLVGKPHGAKGARSGKPRWSESFTPPPHPLFRLPTPGPCVTSS